MANYEYFKKGDKVLVISVVKDEKGKKVKDIIGTGTVITCAKSSINYSVSYIPWFPVITTVQIIDTDQVVSNGPYSKYEFCRVKDYIDNVLKPEKKRLQDEIKEIDNLIDELENIK